MLAQTQEYGLTAPMDMLISDLCCIAVGPISFVSVPNLTYLALVRRSLLCPSISVVHVRELEKVYWARYLTGSECMPVWIIKI